MIDKMGFDIKINKKYLDNKVGEGELTVKGDAFFYFAGQDQDNPIYLIFTKEFSIPQKRLNIPHSTVRPANSYVVICNDANIEFFPSSKYHDMKGQLIKKNNYVMHYLPGRFLRGNESMLKIIGVEINHLLSFMFQNDK